MQGLVISEQSGFYNVEVPDGSIYVCKVRGRLKEAAQVADLVAIGDRVLLTAVPAEGAGIVAKHGIIETILPRSSVLSRAVRTTGKRGSGQAERQQVLIANATGAFFVLAATRPAPNLRMLDRLLVTGEKAGIDRLTIVLNKIDLEDPSHIDALLNPYRRMGYEVLLTSAARGDGVDVLRERMRGAISVFSGPSGVGKTSLLNRIQPGLGRVVKAVSNYDAKGIHTTRDSVLIKLDNGGYLADTPGIRTLAVWDVEPDELDGYFRDLAPFVNLCRFHNCTHTHEPGCAVTAAVEAGAISRTRYDNFLHLREELRETYIVY
ncbi:MAG: ribosome small subunit-dependent GTPase A [Anaerolineae bacterium]|nr:ribosome small subunit-dependent GTPase A [Anaerolineae bacterium]